MSGDRRQIKIGLCGFTMSINEYFETFGVVEVQQTFYEPPALRTLEKWRTAAPPDFEFTMKAWQLITHASTSTTYRRLRTPLSEKEKKDAGAFRWTPVVQRAWEVTHDCARILRAGAILFQCPKSFRPLPENLDNMRKFFGSIDRPPGTVLLWEPRGDDWRDATIRELCTELGLIHTVDPFLRTSLTPALTYWRLHGITGARHVYTDDELRKLEDMIPPSGTTYVMFNEMPRIMDAARFRKLLSHGRGRS